MIYKKGNIAVAISIVIAGLIVAGAVMFTNGDSQGRVAGADIAVNPVNENDWVYGNRNAEIKIVEYSDTECPYCSLLHQTLKQVVSEYDNQVAWVYRHFPIVQLHPIAPTVSHASECVGELGGNDAFWNYIDKIYQLSYENIISEDPKKISEHAQNPDKLREYAVEFGINETEYLRCMEESRHQDKVTEDYQNAQKTGGQGTPFNIMILDNEMNDEQLAVVDGVINRYSRPGERPGIVVSGDNKKISLSGALPYEVWKEIIDSLLN